MQPDSVRFFREKIALDNFYWLGTDDPLGLNADTEGVIAHYRIDELEADLLLIAFPDAAGAQDAFSGLKAAGIEGLLSTKVQGNTIGAVFGKVSPERAEQWINQALDAAQK
jgi:hypothetical protein